MYEVPYNTNVHMHTTAVVLASYAHVTARRRQGVCKRIREVATPPETRLGGVGCCVTLSVCPRVLSDGDDTESISAALFFDCRP